MGYRRPRWPRPRVRFTFEADVTDEALDRAADELGAAVTGRLPVATPGWNRRRAVRQRSASLTDAS